MYMNDRITWQAPEHEHREHGSDWFWVVGIIALSLSVAFVITGNILLSIIIFLGVGMLLFHAKTPPKIINYEISRKGIIAGKKIYLWESLESFWILEKDTTSRFHSDAKILLRSNKPLSLHIAIPLDTYALTKVYNALARILPEEHQMEPAAERLMRNLGF